MAKTNHTDFNAFVQKQQRVGTEDKVDWDKEREEWLHYLNDLYEKIENFLEPYIEAGTIKYARAPFELTEENLGTYKAPQLHIEIGRQIVTLRPVGTMLIGTKGRVDILGSAGKSRLILANKDATSSRDLANITLGASPTKLKSGKKAIDWVWKIVSTPPAIQFTDLNKDTLFQVLMEVSNG